MHTFVTLWNRIINIGVDAHCTDFDKKRIRLLNGICSWAFVIYLIYVICYAADEKVRFVFWESVAGVIGYAAIIIINHYKKYDTACHCFLSFNLLFYIEQAILGGKATGVEYIFVPCSITPMLFFRQFRVIFFYFMANLAAFGIAKFSFVYMDPVFIYSGQERSIMIANNITMFVILFLIILHFKNENTLHERLLEKKNDNLSDEKKKSEKLLLNILPQETADELKETGTAKPKSFDRVTVMFTDFKNFTLASEQLTPEKLVREIHYYFSKFDEIMNKYQIEKIKTIGDSYMCAGGVPKENDSHFYDVVMAALDIQDFMHRKKIEKQSSNEPYFELRLGIHTGPVIAGIVGTNKFAFDIWGDTVNIASRMESSGEVGQVNISGSTFELIKDRFDCSYRGKISAKNKGEIEMYFVENIKQCS